MASASRSIRSRRPSGLRSAGLKPGGHVRQGQEDLQTIPGVGPSISRDLRGIGIERVSDLRGRDPERLYAQSNRRRGVVQDRCLLYVFRCAVYFASTARPKPSLLNWWAWKEPPSRLLRSARTGARR